MKFVRYLSLFLLLALLLTGCVTTPPVENPPVENPPVANDPNALTLVADKESEYVMVRKDTATGEEKQVFLGLNDTIWALTGVPIKLKTDYEKPASEKEILIGNTNREASQAAMAELAELKDLGVLEGPSYLVRVKGEALVVVADTAETLAMGVEELIQKYLKVNAGTMTVARSLNVSQSRLTALLEKETSGSTYKKQYSDYIKDYYEEQLLSFDDVDFDGAVFRQNYSLDETYQREGDGAARIVITAQDKALEQLMWHNNAFDFAVEDLKKTTLKLWVFIEDDDKFTCDHDAGYGRQENQTTLFFRALDRQGRYHAWNHTLTGNGWHEIELSFNFNNGVHDGFDYAHITGFGMMAAAEVGTIVEVDDLRFVTYETDYEPTTLPEGDRWISECEADALDGLIVQEWYGCSYDLEDKKNGTSSVRCEGDPSVNDFRSIFHVGGVPMNYQEDVLVFWMKVNDLRTVSNLFIELNQVQDTHEYEYGISLAKLQEYGLSKKAGEWSKIVVPLSDFRQNFKPDVYGTDENITLNFARFVISGVNGKSYVVHYDDIYLTTKSALGMN